MRRTLLLTLFMLLTATAALARDVPLASNERFSLGLQAGAGWPKDAAVEGVAFAMPAYNLGTTPSLVAPLRYGFGQKLTSLEPSLSVLLKASEFGNVFARAGYGVYWKDGVRSDEPVAGVSFVKPLGLTRFGLTSAATYRTRSKDTTFDVRLGWLAIEGGK